MKKSIRIIFAVTLAFLMMQACDTSDGGEIELQSGNFFAEVSGDISADIGGEAIFSKAYLNGQDYLLLRMKTGETILAFDDTLTTGLLISNSWENSPGSYSLQTPLTTNVVLEPALFFGINDGRIEIEQVGKSEIVGKFSVVATSLINPLDPDAEIEVKGSFIALGDTSKRDTLQSRN